MIRHLIPAAAATLMLSALSFPASAAVQYDPSWPCQQRKVPKLSLGQFWNGPDLPKSAEDWEKDAGVSALVEEVAQRRVPLDEAEKKIGDFAASLAPDRRRERMTMVVQGLFDHMGRERSDVMSGIGHYAHNQADLAAYVRKESSDLDAFRAKPDADPDEVERRTDKLNFDIRTFEERSKSLTYVCEVPTIIEQRLYQLMKTVAGTVAENKK
ncbi:MAG: hypothetical protein L0I29_16335 [Hyphomicrobiales bacterium]|nr:hypothetical protein [Hyphomicrobiales bacterium]